MSNKIYITRAKKSDWDFNFWSDKVQPTRYKVIARLIGDWDPNIKISKRKKYNASNPNVKKQQELYGLTAPGRFDDGLMTKKQEKIYGKLFNAIGLKNADQMIHVQKPGQMHIIHIDDAYAGGRFNYMSEQIKRKKVHRVFIMLDDWHPGQVMLMGNQHVYKWKKGDVLWFDWPNLPHGTANFGHHDRPLLFITGEETEQFKKLLKKKRNIKI